jgi:DNA-binding CsgD family transcriptional regulator/PAS domain-containing protein
MAAQMDFALSRRATDAMEPARLDRLLDLVGSIYDASLKPKIWPEILATLAPFYGTDKGSLLSVDPEHPEAAASYAVGMDSILSPSFRERPRELDYWCLRSKRLPGGSVFLGSELLSIEETRSSAVYQEFGKPFGIEYLIGGIISNTPRHLAIISFFRDGKDFDLHSKRLMSLLLPHLRMALFVNRRLGEITDGQEAAREVLDSRHEHGIIMLNGDGDIIFANRHAVAIGARGDGISLSQNRISFRNAADQDKFDRLRQSASHMALEATTEGGGLFLVRRRGAKPPVEVVVSPVRRSALNPNVPTATRCIVFIHDPADNCEISGKWLKTVYGLTPAEVRLCEALFQHESLAVASTQLRITENTARSQLKGVFLKLGVSSQGQLLRRLALSLTLRFNPQTKQTSTRRRKRG